MPYLSVAVVAIGVLCLLNLAVTLALVRRVRRQGGQSADRSFTDGRRPWHLPTGSRAPEFTATTVSGETRSLSDLTGAKSVIAFLSVHCPPCVSQLPALKRYAESVPGGVGQVLAIICGPEGGADQFVRELNGVASVVVEPTQGPTARAFSASTFPTFYRLDEDGRIETSGVTVGGIAEKQLV